MVSETLDNDKSKRLPEYLRGPGLAPSECPLGSLGTLAGQTSTYAYQMSSNCIHTLCGELQEGHQ